ncbi:hypothetical protein ASJ33_00325 [Dehalococcoides mccartyi]|jgi:hypothetical protein|uniref:zf-TFIIB domain-containing protein n=1 Tax=Dehalococcoides mccartyi TaxID=61435 RepID=UPI0004E05A2C|nr:zf-TFIIB domain-containing protein [Dehalococcoides mccartyi]AII58588.1 hypothetical protein X792_07940 [Dehalococcoides mccartyi CG1]APH11705.1 hypothetical protein ASJ33_00325 [Dehalococcoides mccartyi]
MICPACSKDMLVVEYREIELDYCPACHGVWFDVGELGLLLNEVNLSTVQKTEEITDSHEAKRHCPICRRKMKKTALLKDPLLITDDCPSGHGMFFDGGEVDQLITRLSKDTNQPAVDFLKEVFKAR